MKKALAIAIAASVAVSLPFYGYTWNLLMHILGAILFLGNILVTAVWFSLARRSGSDDALAFAARGVMTTDAFFTTPGAILLLLNGGIMGTAWFKTAQSWIIVSVVFFLVSALVWLAVLVPLQRKMVDVAHIRPMPPEMKGLVAAWFRYGGVAVLFPLATLILMVAKPVLW